MNESEILLWWLPAFQLGALAAVLRNDRRRLLQPLSPREALWRRRRFIATIICLVGLAIAYGTLYTKGPYALLVAGATIVIVALIAMLGCSFPLKAARREARIAAGET